VAALIAATAPKLRIDRDVWGASPRMVTRTVDAVVGRPRAKLRPRARVAQDGARRPLRLGDRDLAVIVAVAGVIVVQVTGNEIVDVVAVRDLRMSASRPVLVRAFVPTAPVRAAARRRVLRVDADGVLVDVPIVRMVQVAVMQVIGVAFVQNGLMAAARAMLVVVFLVNTVAHR
jgi:hypothetical protein